MERDPRDISSDELVQVLTNMRKQAGEEAVHRVAQMILNKELRGERGRIHTPDWRRCIECGGEFEEPWFREKGPAPLYCPTCRTAAEDCRRYREKKLRERQQKETP